MNKLAKFDNSDIKGIECVFATYAANPYFKTDALIVKEKIHLNDGRIIPNMRIWKDKKWPFYVTREGFRKHKEKKEAEYLNRLQRYECTRLELPKRAAQALNMYTAKGTLRELHKSPYLYGTDILPTSLIKEEYQRNNKNITTSQLRVAAFDIETNVVDGSGDVIMANLCYYHPDFKKTLAYTAVTQEYVGQNPDFVKQCKAKAYELIPEDMESLNVEWEIEIVGDPATALAKTIQKGHEWKPDIITIWNMNFDIPETEKQLIKGGYDPADVFSDPAVPPEYRFFKYTEGNSIKKTQSGKETPIHPADRWHYAQCPSSFYFVDSMCLYKRIRTAAGNLNSYALNAVLEHENLPVKLKHKDTEELEEDGTAWHFAMQKYHKVVYTIYNLVDDLRLLQLDMKTGDIRSAFGTLAGISDFCVFNKNPRRIADDLHFFYLERNLVVASTDPDMAKDPNNDIVVGMDNWISTLPSYMNRGGKHLFIDAPHIQTMLFTNLSDLDISGTYPNEEDIENISKDTTAFETCGIRGMTEQDQRYLGLTLTGGKSNALELAMRYFNYPSPDQILRAYREHKTVASQP